jgi:dipeptidyl-peptidase-4
MEFILNTNKLLIKQLNRKQNKSNLFIAKAFNRKTEKIQEESDEAWMCIFKIEYTNYFSFLEDTNSILCASDEDGWRH